MSTNAARIFREALDLPETDRADLAAELLASLEPAESSAEEDIEAAWATEIERRARRFLAGESQGIEWADARARVLSSLDR
jgi:hypothetical protein